MPVAELSLSARRHWMGLGLLCLVLQVTGCASTTEAVASVPMEQPVTDALASQWGIRVEGLRLSSAGSMLDFRYRVLDAKKAAPLLDGKSQPTLLDAAHGARLGVPESPVLGRIRQTARNNNILLDRNYFIMFGNPGKVLRSGDTVTLLLGQVKITDLTVQ